VQAQVARLTLILPGVTEMHVLPNAQCSQLSHGLSNYREKRENIVQSKFPTVYGQISSPYYAPSDQGYLLYRATLVHGPHAEFFAQERVPASPFQIIRHIIEV
jgi:hypothetical protein